MKGKIDTIDVSILQNLQDDGRMTNVELANKAGISAPPCLRRLRRLEQENIIMGYFATINGAALGYDFTALCFVSLDKQTSDRNKLFISYINQIDEVRKCSSTSGEFDFILKIVTKNFTAYEKFLNDKIKSYPNIVSVKSFPISQCCKNKNGIPMRGILT